MKRTLRLLAIALAATSLSLWIVTGANRGWTRTSEQVKTLDEVTGLEAVSYQKRFVPGLDFLGALLAGSVALGAASIFVRGKTPPQTPP